MSKKCLYCSTELSEDNVIDFCEKCGKGVWGEKMFNAIVTNMENAREKGDLCHTEPVSTQHHPPETLTDITDNKFY